MEITKSQKEELIKVLLNTRNFCGNEALAELEFCQENQLVLTNEVRFEIMSAVDFQWFDCGQDDDSFDKDDYQEVFR